MGGLENRLGATIYLARHGRSTWNEEGRVAGQLDPPLSLSGQRQAANLALVLKDVALTRIYVSPQTRALETASVVARIQGLDPQICEDLRERSFGMLEGRCPNARDPAAQRLWAEWKNKGAGGALPGGESVQALEQRVVPCLAKILDSAREGAILIVAHRHTNGVILGTLLGRPRASWPGFNIKTRYLYEIVPDGPQVATIAVEGHRIGKRWPGIRGERT